MLIGEIESSFEKLGLDLKNEQKQNIIHYITLLTKWNRTYNLTAIRDEREIWIKHIFDSLSILPYVQGEQVLDVGTGAGLPGLIWAIARPDSHYTLLDGNQKKTRFIQQVAGALQLMNVDVVHSRIEQYHPKIQFDTITSRAYSEVSAFYQQTAALCRQSGCWLAMKGTYPQAEIEALPPTILKIEVAKITVPLLVGERHLVILRPAT